VRTVTESDVAVPIYSIVARNGKYCGRFLKEDVTEFALYAFELPELLPIIRLIQQFESLLITFLTFEVKFRWRLFTAQLKRYLPVPHPGAHIKL